MSMMYHNLQAVVQVNGKHSEAFSIDRSVGPAGLPLVPFSLRSRFWSPCSVGLGMRGIFRPCAESPWLAASEQRFPRSPMTSLSSCPTDWRHPTRALPREWRTHLHPRSVVWVRPSAGAKLVGITGYCRSAGSYLASKAVVLKGQGGGVRRVHLYHLSVLPLPKDHRVTLEQSLFKLLWKGRRPLVRRQVCCQRPRDGGLGMLDLESNWLAERLAYLGRSLTNDMGWGLKVRNAFLCLRSRLKAAGGREMKHCLSASAAGPYETYLGPVNFRGLVAGSVSDPLARWLGWSVKEIRSQWNWAPGSSFLNNEFSLTWRLVRNVLALNNWAYRACLADMPNCPCCSSGLQETALQAFYYCERVRLFWSHVEEWTARISPQQLVLLDVGSVVDNVDLPFQGEKRVVFLAILAVARMVIWQTQNKRLYDGANFFHRDLILFFRYQLRVKIRCDRKRLDHITFSKKWEHAASLVVRKGEMLESSFPPLPAHGDNGPGPSGPHPG